jgi:hypothetical protein
MKLPCKYTPLTFVERRNVRGEYIKQQKGLCWYCQGKLDEEPPEKILKYKVTPRLYPKGFFDNPIHLHHDHVTDMTLGAVHAYCNAVLWKYYGQ